MPEQAPEKAPMIFIDRRLLDGNEHLLKLEPGMIYRVTVPPGTKLGDGITAIGPVPNGWRPAVIVQEKPWWPLALYWIGIAFNLALTWSLLS